MKSLLNFSNLNTLRRLVLLSLLICFSCIANGQASEVNPLNDIGSSTDFLGWDPSVNDDIRIRHLTPSQPILFGTNGVERMRISPNVNRSVMINAPSPNNSKLRITQIRGDGAVQAELVNMDGNALNRALKVGINIPS
jgi:hypothetical protein